MSFGHEFTDPLYQFDLARSLARDDSPTTTPDFKQPFLPQYFEGPKQGVDIDTETPRDLTSRGQPFSGSKVTPCNRRT